MSIFDTSGFPLRGSIGAWTPLLKYTYIFSNFLISISFFIIPFILINVWRRKRDIVDSWMLLLFSLFIFLCGLLHLKDIISFWWVPFRFYVLMYFFTGIISSITAVLLPSVAKRKLRLLSREEYHKLNNDLQVEISQKEIAIMEKDTLIEDLRKQISSIEKSKRKGAWIDEQEKVLVSLKTLLSKNT